MPSWSVEIRGSRATETNVTEPAWSAHLPAGVEAADVDLARGGTLPHLWNETWLLHPDREVLHDETNGWVNGDDLRRRTVDVAARLSGGGLRSGDRVILGAGSSIDFVCVHAACLGLGAIVVPTSPAYGRDELAHVVADAAPTMAIVEDDEQAQFIAEADGSVVVGGLDVEFDPISTNWPVAEASRPAMIGYTSGTTGRPKGAVLSHANLLAGVNSLVLSWRWTSDDRLVLSLPLFHMHGLGVGLHGTLSVGASAVLQKRFEPDAVIDAIADHRATLFFGVPTMYHRLAQSARAGELARLRLMVCGSAAMPAELHARMFDLTQLKVLERYGMTETVMLVSNPYGGERRGGSVGLPLPGVELRLVGEPPEVQVRGPNVFSAYWGNRSATADAFDGDWFRTGDLGSVDDAGYLSIVGRSKELIISGGMNIYPREVEDAVRTHPDVSDVAVVGTASAEWGELVTAYVTGQPLSLVDLRVHLDGSLAAYKQPRLLHLVGELPRNALGKVQKHLLEP